MTLKVQDLTVALGGRELIADLSLTVPRGTFLAIVGPNGAGKTTLLRAIAGLVLSHGTVSWDGRDLTRVAIRDRARAMAYMPQAHHAYWPIRARDAVAIGRFPHVSSLATLAAEDQLAIEGALKAVDASHLADRPITELSGGERARIMLARALAVDAPIVLADEPVSALDPAHQLAIIAKLRALAHGERVVIAVLHDIALASRFADRIVVLGDGSIKSDGRPDEVLTPDLLGDVFGIAAETLVAGSERATVPWSAIEKP